MSAILYGFEGKGYTMKSAIDFFSSLYNKGRLKSGLSDSPLTICYDYQAVQLVRNGRNIEIIIPRDGTLTYQKGLWGGL